MECCFCRDPILNKQMNFCENIKCDQCNNIIIASSHKDCYYYFGVSNKNICNKCALKNKIKKKYIGVVDFFHKMSL